MTATYEKLQGSGTMGDFVLNGQKCATEQGFSHVSSIWYDKTLTYEQAHSRIESDRAQSRDILCGPEDFVPTVKGRELVFTYKPEGLTFKPTEHALKQACGKLGIAHSYPFQLQERAHQDGYATDILHYIFNEEWKYLEDKLAVRGQRVNKNGKASKLAERNKFLFRVRQDGTMRAMLSEIYAIINNSWLLEVMEKIIPDGRVSHFRGDSDTMQFNILVPDTLRKEEDSDYGGMVSTVNSEIGTLRHDVWPSVFRAICMNGCIWDRKMGKSIEKVHKGNIDLVEYSKLIKECVVAQLDLLPQWTDIMLGTKLMTTKVNIEPMLAQIALDNKLAKSEAKLLMTAYKEEVSVYNLSKNTLFGIVNTVTRAGQAADFNTYQWDIIGGRLVSYDDNKWEAFTGRAARLDKETVDETLGLVLV